MSAKNLKFSAARAAWPRACVTGRPVSKVSSAAIRAARASMPSAILFSTVARARPASPGHGPASQARHAAATARSTSAGPPAATAAYGRLLTGSATSNVAPSALAAGAPPMKCSSTAGRPSGGLSLSAATLVTAGTSLLFFFPERAVVSAQRSQLGHGWVEHRGPVPQQGHDLLLG